MLRRDDPRQRPLAEAIRDAPAAELVDVLAVEVEASRAGAGAGHDGLGLEKRKSGKFR
jgi:hypothetical protein